MTDQPTKAVDPTEVARKYFEAQGIALDAPNSREERRSELTKKLDGIVSYQQHAQARRDALEEELAELEKMEEGLEGQHAEIQKELDELQAPKPRSAKAKKAKKRQGVTLSHFTSGIHKG